MQEPIPRMLMDVNMVTKSKNKTGVCTKTTLRRDCSRTSSTLFWVFETSKNNNRNPFLP